MKYKDKWQLLLGEMRFREKSPTIPSDGRNPFENDYGRLISSAPIRRLQDKTQVFPLEKSDFIRTRLTHSLEVSYIASSIGQSIEKILLDKKDITINEKGLLSSLLRVSGLIHDLGNPPFGHFGEEAVQKFFIDYFIKKEKEGKGHLLNELEKSDFRNFDGNVQTLRILSKLYYFGDEFGYNLTYSSLSSIIKYPSNSVEGNKGKSSSEIAKKKFGYFVTERETYNELNKHLKTNNRRSPIVYLLEAADDIAYSAADIEDGIKLGIINIFDVRDIFLKNLTVNKDSVIAKIDELIKLYSEKNLNKSIIIQKFRIHTQRIMIEEIINSFVDKYDEIINGELEEEIIDISKAADIRKAYKRLQYKVFDDKNIVKKEIAGWEAIYGLLKIFTKASESPDFKPEGNTYESRLYKMISLSHRIVFEEVESYENEEYKKLQLIVDFITGMTDSYAINLYQELKGIKL
ncbi:dNTP triphosphohydrolase [Flavobacterium azooxidireducens]|uniref:DNTP triphosphohydrolase n=1 Tax=Flavobacterium azooxidireducens TaxID=1871076 RepID=A0ABY4KD99_9FLAO|nr:dNTP triphosphohydrolase [Flavobacterium azooxidireducens]UPQ78770.1 dNTP triphosphohydrolase [Flavobacterium azooxidireducens]